MAKQTFFGGAQNDDRADKDLFFGGVQTEANEAAAAVTILVSMWDSGQSVPVLPRIEVVTYR